MFFVDTSEHNVIGLYSKKFKPKVRNDSYFINLCKEMITMITSTMFIIISLLSLLMIKSVFPTLNNKRNFILNFIKKSVVANDSTNQLIVMLDIFDSSKLEFSSKFVICFLFFFFGLIIKYLLTQGNQPLKIIQQLRVETMLKSILVYLLIIQAILGGIYSYVLCYFFGLCLQIGIRDKKKDGQMKRDALLAKELNIQLNSKDSVGNDNSNSNSDLISELKPPYDNGIVSFLSGNSSLFEIEIKINPHPNIYNETPALILIVFLLLALF